MKQPRRFLLLLALLLPVRLGAVVVLLLSTDDNPLNLQTQAVLQAAGHTVTIGSPYTTFTGAELAGIQVVLLFPNANWGAGDMPLLGQTALLNFVNAGGGLVTSEWTNWKVGTGAFASLGPLLPVVSSTQYTGGSAITYTSATPNAVLNAGLPAAFTFSGDYFAGVESFFSLKPGATAYYSSAGGAGGAGLVGWAVGAGHVLQFSTVAGPLELADANYARLLQNSAAWAAIPEPATSLLMLVGLGGLLWFRARRR